MFLFTTCSFGTNIDIVVYGIVRATMLILMLFLFVTYWTAYKVLGEYSPRSLRVDISWISSIFVSVEFIFDMIY